MSYQGSSKQAAGQQKAAKYCLIIAAVAFALIFVIGIIAAMPRKMKEWTKEKNHKAMYELFYDTDLIQSDEPPVIKRPYTVYGLNNDSKWEYRKDIDADALLLDEGITETVKDARTCIFIWADSNTKKKSEEYYWSVNGAYDHDAYFSPVYMTVIDKENKVRYDDIEIGNTPKSSGNKLKSGHSMKLYQTGKEWSTFDFENWLPDHWE